MTDYAQPLVIPRPRTRIMDRIVIMAHKVSPWLAAAVLGFIFGLAQGAIQSDNHWTSKIIERSTVDPSGVALPVYEDQGQVYYVHREVRP